MSKEEVKATASEENITISKGEFVAMMERIERLENPGIPQRVKRTKEHIVNLRVYEGDLVIGIGKAREDLSLPQAHRDYLSIDIKTVDLQGKEKVRTVNYLDFLSRAPSVTAKMTKIAKTERVATDTQEGGGGYGMRLVTNKEGWATPEASGEEIAFEVGYVDVAVTAEVLQGDFTGKVFTFEGDDLTALNA